MREQRARDGQERNGEPDCDREVQPSARLAGILALEPLADRDRNEDHACECEPRDPADSRERTDEGDHEDAEIEGRELPPASDHERDGHRHEEVEDDDVGFHEGAGQLHSVTRPANGGSTRSRW